MVVLFVSIKLLSVALAVVEEAVASVEAVEVVGMLLVVEVEATAVVEAAHMVYLPLLPPSSHTLT